jgi:hypothetical protein
VLLNSCDPGSIPVSTIPFDFSIITAGFHRVLKFLPGSVNDGLPWCFMENNCLELLKLSSIHRVT